MTYNTTVEWLVALLHPCGVSSKRFLPGVDPENASKNPKIKQRERTMEPWQIVWDLEDDLEGNVQHILEHDITMDEVE
jgi:hypothetical protein